MSNMTHLMTPVAGSGLLGDSTRFSGLIGYTVDDVLFDSHEHLMSSGRDKFADEVTAIYQWPGSML